VNTQVLLTWHTQTWLDIVLLVGHTSVTVNGGMIYIIVEVSKGADSVKQQFISVLASDGDQPVVIVAAVRDANLWLAVLRGPAQAACEVSIIFTFSSCLSGG
jgi:hypothetical protein